ncbi:hypothetical protein, partial [Methylobacterium oxalidis]|uniref:hypothetical protein n=1 Tax=Methylobacterium oxalidis TaxID=944322 RepID=UPI0024E15471
FRASFCCVASSVSQATYGAETHPALTSKLDHLVGADQRSFRAAERPRLQLGAFRTIARRKAEQLMKSHHRLAIKRGGTRWYVHREALR